MKPVMLMVTLLLAIAACTQVVPPPKSADHYFQEGEDFFSRNMYQDAIASWEKVRDTYQSPELTARAELKIAEAHYLAGNYLEAAAAFEAFLKQRPDADEKGEILYLLGMSHFKQVLSIDRDQTSTRNALATFENLRSRFPDHSKGAEVAELILRCRENLAAHELYVGTFYLRTKRFTSAVGRLTGIPGSYPDFARLDETYYRLGVAQLRAGSREEAVASFNTLFRRWPESTFIRKAQKILAEEY